MKVQVMVTASGLITLDVDKKTAERLKSGEVATLADIDPDWDEVLNQLDFEVDDAT